MHIAIVDGEVLTAALQRMGGISGRKLGSAFWRFTDRLTITWAGMVEEVEARIVGKIHPGLMLAPEAMEHACARLTYKGLVDLTWSAGKLGIGRDLLPATEATSDAPIQLHVGADIGDLLRAILERGAESLEASGFQDEVDEAMARWEETIDSMVESLAWTGGIDAHTLEAVVAQLLRSGARLPRRADEEERPEPDKVLCSISFDRGGL